MVIYQLFEEEVFFLGGVIVYQVQPVLTGERNFLDLFTHKSSLIEKSMRTKRSLNCKRN